MTNLFAPRTGTPRRAGLAQRLLACCLQTCCLLVMFLFTPAHAAPGDPPARMGRLSLLVGTVEATLEEGMGWTPAVLNLPLGGMSRIRTGVQSRAELRIGSVTLHVDANTTVVLRTVDDDHLVLGLLRGELALHLPSLASAGRLSVFATATTFDRAVTYQPSSSGRYLFARAPGGPLKAQVLEGQLQWRPQAPSGAAATAQGPVPAVPVAAGRQVTADLVQRSLGDATEAAESAFTEWARVRALRVPNAETLRHVSAEMTGAEDLDKHGSWATDPRWGALWLPAGAAADWAPYRQGRWVFTARRGWAWVDDTPWGFAPFHYGRWLFNGGRWAWAPGARVERPVYAPALVGFYGNGTDASAWVGWFPLAPGEALRPAFAASAEYVQNLNAPAFERLVSKGHRYANTLFAATAMGSEAFVNGQPVAAAAVALNPGLLTAAGVRDVHAPAALPAPAKPAAAP